MKLSNIFHPSRSIAGRLTSRVMLTIILVFTVIATLIFGLTWVVLLGVTTQNYQEKMEVSSEKTNNVFGAVEVVISNIIPEVENNLDNSASWPSTPTLSVRLLPLNRTTMPRKVSISRPTPIVRAIPSRPSSWVTKTTSTTIWTGTRFPSCWECRDGVSPILTRVAATYR